jgi:HPt (histidine-containing phosphotransfer) domain-containing protein
MTAAYATASTDISDLAGISDTSIIDRDAILEQFEGDAEFLREVVQLFLAACPRRLSAIHEAILGCDTTALQMAAHSIRGSASYFGALAVMAAASDLETMGREGSLPNAGEACEKLEQELARLKQALAALVQSPSESAPRSPSVPEEVPEELPRETESN